ncbi:MAG: DNA cytosine methyltransferase [Nitrososphaerota archaeon]|nr:DNA cytosine methyltransferase [Nitrososphaerota archaeon]
MTEFRLGELFCGAGGLAIAAKIAQINHKTEKFSITHAWANDYNKDACETYRQNIMQNNVTHCDVAKLEMEKLPPTDALAFGFPCNDFSAVGEKKGFNGSYGPLYRYGIEALEYFRPKWFLAENVRGLCNTHDGEALRVILKELAATGYDIVPHLYRFEQYGVPQTRHRIIIIGTRKDLKLTFQVPAPLNEPPVTCQEAIENPPITDDAPNHEFTKQSPRVVERLQHIKEDQNAFTAELPIHLRLRVRGATISQIYRRLNSAKPAYTVTGSGGGGTHIYHWRENRALTNRERARLQTFPDTFVFCGPKGSVRRQIGMAVPPKGARIIFEALLKTFADIPYDHVKPNMETFSTNKAQSEDKQTCIK